jgi:hypothetical protein
MLKWSLLEDFMRRLLKFMQQNLVIDIIMKGRKRRKRVIGIRVLLLLSWTPQQSLQLLQVIRMKVTSCVSLAMPSYTLSVNILLLRQEPEQLTTSLFLDLMFIIVLPLHLPGMYRLS